MLVDLSVPLSETTPVYPGDPATKIATAGVLAESGYQDHYVSFGTHVGTHIDAPSHMIEGGKNLDTFPIEAFSGRGVYVRVAGAFSLEELRAADIREGDIVLFHTGMSERYGEPAYFEDYAAITEEVADYLIGKKVRMVGVDTCSVDRAPYPIHKMLLAAEVLIIENLTNVGALAGKEFAVYAFPLKLPLDGAPTRVVADIAA